MYKTVFVDWDGTLSNSRFWERWSNDPKRQAAYAAIQENLFQNARDVVQDWTLGLRSTAAIVDHLTRTTGLSYDELIEELRYSCEHMKFIENNAIGIVQNIRGRGTKVIIATDNMDTFQRWTVPALNINDLFDGVLSSDAQGALKAHRDTDGKSLFFQHYLSQNNIKPGQAVLIDNNHSNRVVEHFGIDFLHVTPKSSLTSHLTDCLSLIR